MRSLGRNANRVAEVVESLGVVVVTMIKIEPDSSRYLNGASLEVEVVILISVVYDFNPDSLYIAKDQRLLTGSINVTALDTGQGASGQTPRVVSCRGLPTESEREQWKNT